MQPRTHKPHSNTCRLQVELLESREMLAAYTVERVLNINPGTTGSDPKNFTAVGEIVYFTATTTNQGTELWRTDGTATGTKIVKDITAGSLSSNPTYLTNVGGTLYFAANDRVHGKELWKSDGTAQGTVKIPDLQNGKGGSYPRWLTNVNGTLFFTAFAKSVGRELHRLTPMPNQNPPATLVIDLERRVPPSISADFGPTRLTEVNGKLFFSTYSENKLFLSDGTSAGTEELLYQGHSFKQVREPMNIGGTLYFRGQNSIDHFASFGEGIGTELWRSDGSTGETLLVKDLWSGAFYCGYHGEGPCSFYDSYPRYFANANGTLYFSAIRSTDPRIDLMKTDGTAASTKVVKTFYESGENTGPYDCVKFITAVGNDVYFSGRTSDQGRELWKSNGTPTGTKMVKEIARGTFSGSPASLINYHGELIFTAYDNVHGQEIWMSDGSVNGTQLIKDINSGRTGSAPRHLANVNGTLYFSANDGSSGAELWKLEQAPPPQAALQLSDHAGSESVAFVTFTEVQNRDKRSTNSRQDIPSHIENASLPAIAAPFKANPGDHVLPEL